MSSNRVSLAGNDYDDVEQPNGRGIHRLGEVLPRVLVSYGLAAPIENEEARSGAAVGQGERLPVKYRVGRPR